MTATFHVAADVVILGQQALGQLDLGPGHGGRGVCQCP